MSHGSRSAIREFDPQWIINIPELETRENLLRALETRPDIRRKVFQTAQAMESIALIPARHVAARCLALWWRECRKDIYRYWHDKLRSQTGTDQLFNELYGCLRNVYFNMRLKSGNPMPKSFHPKKGHVTRTYGERSG